MRSSSQVWDQLFKLFKKRLQLRLDRKLKPICRNCKNKTDDKCEFNGFSFICYKCNLKLTFNKEKGCERFECLYTTGDIKDEFLKDLKDPAIRAAKEPQINTLLWVANGEQSWWDKVSSLFTK